MRQLFQNRKYKTILIVGVIILVGLIGLWAYKITTFHIVKTDPSLTAVSADAPYMRIYFNKDLDKTSLEFTDDVSEIISKTDVNNKTITIYFKGALVKSADYTIIINTIKSVNGSEITNKQFNFTAQDIPFNDLSAEQKKALIGQQDKPLYEVNNISYPGFDALLDYGITDQQLQNIKARLFDYSNIVKQQFRTMELKPSSIKVPPRDSTSSTSRETISFNVTLGENSYSAEVTYDLSYDSINIKLTDPNGATAYNSLADQD